MTGTILIVLKTSPILWITLKFAISNLKFRQKVKKVETRNIKNTLKQ